MNILIIEDDTFKYSKIEELVNDIVPGSKVIRFDNVHGSIIFLKDNTPDKIILDMSLPSHSAKVGEGNPLSMPAGGIEIILELRSLQKNDIPIIVLTQYPDIEIENEYFSISDAGEEIREHYNISNITVTYFESDLDDWKCDATQFLRG